MSRITEILREYTTIAVIGMCKNAGKTTAVNHIIEEYKDDYRIGITSIGYDGEERDEITLLDKPRIDVQPDMMVATCECCLKSATAGYKKIMDTDIRTALGKVIIIRIKSEGYVEVAGPSMVSQIDAICHEMKKLGCDKILVDGSAGRLSFASHMDCAILSVGAAIAKDMHKVIKLAKHQTELLNLNQCTNSYMIKFSGDKPYAVLNGENDVQIIFRGAMVNDDLDEVMHRYRGKKKTAIANDAASVFISDRMLKRFENKNGKICVLNKTNLALITINPMSPYGKWFDKDKFLDEMRKNMDIPVFNVFDEKDD
jgi:molybdopterin-guanine dinucleotide biosynthesis protein